jgi:hypothetical protein
VKNGNVVASDRGWQRSRGSRGRGIARVAAPVLAIVVSVALASCSSGPSTGTTTSTTAAATAAPCTVAAISAALPGETVTSHRCGNGWAAGTDHNAHYTSAYLLQAKNGAWVQASDSVCQKASALGIPDNVLAVSPCKVS